MHVFTGLFWLEAEFRTRFKTGVPRCRASVGAMWGFSPHLIGMLLAPPVAFGDVFCFFLSQKRLLQVPETWFDTTRDTFETFVWDEFCVDSLRLSIGQCSIRAHALLIA